MTSVLTSFLESAAVLLFDCSWRPSVQSLAAVARTCTRPLTGPPLCPKVFYISAQHHPFFSRSLFCCTFHRPVFSVGRFFPVKHLTNETLPAQLFLLEKHFSIFGIHTTGLGQSAVEARNARTRISFDSASWPSSQMPVRSLVTGAPVPACCVCRGEVAAFVHIVRLWFFI